MSRMKSATLSATSAYSGLGAIKVMSKPVLLLVIADATCTGAPQQVLFLARGMSEDYDVQVVCPKGWLTDELHHLKIVTHVWPSGNAISIIRQLSALYTRISPDILHCHGVRAGIAGRLARIPGSTRVLYTEHLWTKDYHLKSGIREWVQLSLLRFCSLKTHHTVAVSRAVLTFLEAKTIVGAGMASVVYGAIEPLPHTKLPHKVVIGTVGSLTWVKGIDTVLRALPSVLGQHKDAEFHIAGDGPERERLKKIALRLGVASSVHWHHEMRGKELCEKLTVYVQPSLSESFGMAPLEAMSAGIPVVAASTGALSEIIRSGRDGLIVPPRDHQSLATAILQLLSDKALFTKLSEQGEKRALEFSVQKMVQEYQKIYAELENHAV